MKPGDYVVIKDNVTDQPQVVGLVGVVSADKRAETGDGSTYWDIYDFLVKIPHFNDEWAFRENELRRATQADILAAKLQGLL